MDGSATGLPPSNNLRVVCDGSELTNGLNWVEWVDDPVQVIVCGHCGYTHCARGNYVHISRLGEHLLWTPPRIDPTDDFAVAEYTPLAALLQYGAVVVPSATWEAWRRQSDNVPPFDALSPTRRVDLVDAWLLEMPASLPPESVQDLRDHLDQWILACDAPDLPVVVATMARLIDWTLSDPEAPVEGSLVECSAVAGRLTTLYLNTPRFDEWTALASIKGNYTFALGSQLLSSPPLA